MKRKSENADSRETLKQLQWQVFLLKNFVFHPQPPESGLLESGVRH